MKATDRAILMPILLVGLLVAFYFLLLGPKRDTASQLNEEISSLQDSISQQEATAEFAEEARQEFPEQYGRLVVLGKAVPERADSASMLVQLNSIAERAGVDFRGIKAAESAGAPAPAPPPAPAPGAAPAPGTPPAEATPTATEVPAPATEAVAATLPIGAGIGPAGLPTLPYQLDFVGGFFDVGNFIGGLDQLVSMRGSGQVAVDGRLMTVDGFALEGGAPKLAATFSVTTYVTPSDQGLTLGATPTAPAPSPAQPQTTPTSAVSP